MTKKKEKKEEEEMSDSEMWAEHKKDRQAKRWSNHDQSIKYLKDHGITVTCLKADIAHYRVGGFDYWPTTGKFYDPKTGKKGRGVKNLVHAIKSKEWLQK